MVEDFEADMFKGSDKVMMAMSLIIVKYSKLS